MNRDIDFPHEAVGPATLCLIEDEANVLIIDKKRGPGSKWFNFPGGKINPDETPQEAAIRETREEVGLSVWNLYKFAELFFILNDEPYSYVHVFKTSTYSGTIRETDEAVPLWFKYSTLPLDSMWPTDAYWVPYLRDGECIFGRFELAASNDVTNIEIQPIREFPSY